MNSGFYPKLAVTNIKKNGKTYIPYIITCIITIIMFYNIHALSINEGIAKMQGGESLKVVLALGNIVVGIFSVIFIFYTNSFLIKKRKNEFGLYNVLGLEKRHIGRVLLFENLITVICSLALGLLGGIITNKLMFLALLKLVGEKNPIYFYISVKSILVTLILFIGLFIVIYLFNLLQIRLANPIELIRGSNQGEREPKTKWILTIIGFGTLIAGYVIAVKVQHPLQALSLFFIAVILVIIGTYCLFTAGSIALLKLLRKNKNFYYKTNNFISISGMMYRMKQNAVGLANICILSTMVLVMVSTTISLYAGLDDAAKGMVNRDIRLEMHNPDNFKEIEAFVNENVDVNKISNKLDYEFSTYQFMKNGNNFTNTRSSMSNDVVPLIAIALDDYNRLEGKSETLNDDEVIVRSSNSKFNETEISIDSKIYKVKEIVNQFNTKSLGEIQFGEGYTIIAKDVKVLGDKALKTLNYSFDYKGSEAEIRAISDKMQSKSYELGGNIGNYPETRQLILGIYGGLFFLGIFLGTLFLMATVLIIYYKQISEGIEDKNRFEIMQKVGMDQREIKKTIRKQILMMFFLPLIFAVVHISFAFPMIEKLLAVLQLKNVNLFIISTAITVGIFTVIYTIVFGLTAKTYYKVIKK